MSRALYLRQTNRLIARIRAGLTAKIYRHTTELGMNDVKDAAALTLMGSDVERIVQALRFVHEVWASLPEIAVAVWLLANKISFACVVPLVVSLGESPHLNISTSHGVSFISIFLCRVHASFHIR